MDRFFDALSGQWNRVKVFQTFAPPNYFKILGLELPATASSDRLFWGTRPLGFFYQIRKCFPAEGHDRVGFDAGSNSSSSFRFLQIPVGIVHSSKMEILHMENSAQGSG